MQLMTSGSFCPGSFTISRNRVLSSVPSSLDPLKNMGSAASLPHTIAVASYISFFLSCGPSRPVCAEFLLLFFGVVVHDCSAENFAELGYSSSSSFGGGWLRSPVSHSVLLFFFSLSLGSCGSASQFHKCWLFSFSFVGCGFWFISLGSGPVVSVCVLVSGPCSFSASSIACWCRLSSWNATKAEAMQTPITSKEAAIRMVGISILFLLAGLAKKGYISV